MLNIYNSNTLTNFSADVFMCEEHHTASGLCYWTLRLIVQGKLIDAFHWQVVGKWTTERKERFQVIRSEMIASSSANEDEFYSNKSSQLEFDFGNKLKLSREG